MFFLSYLLALILFVLIYLTTRVILFWLKKDNIWPLISYKLLIRSILYSGLTLLLLGIIYLVFKKVNVINLLWLDGFIYLFVILIKPEQIFSQIKNKEKYRVKKNHLLGASIFVFILLECFLFNFQAYNDNKKTFTYQDYINEGVSSDGEIENNKIILKSKQSIYITTNQEEYENLYLHFNNDDMNLYINIYEKYVDEEEYVFKKYVLINPTVEAYGYISLDNMDKVKMLKIEFDIDSSRYLNNISKPTIIVDKISFDAYFPLIINPLRLGGLIALTIFVFNFKKIVINKSLNEDNIYQKIEKVILLSGAVVFVYFIIQALINNSAYFIKYDDLYLGGTSSNNIYYQQFVAYLKGQLHLDVDVDARLLELDNPYNPSSRSGITYLWDHAFYNGKYYSYYGHAPIYLVMFPIYLISGYVPSNLFILQLGVLFSVLMLLLATLKIMQLFIKKTNNFFLILTLVSIAFGSLLFTNNTYEYGAMIYRIPYAYGNGFLFLSIYLILKGYRNDKYRSLFYGLGTLSIVFIVLSRPALVIYLLLFIPLIIKSIIKDKNNFKHLLVNYLPAFMTLLTGAIIVSVMNYMRFNSILEFGEHYQLTVTDCTKNRLSIDGILPTIYHYFLKAPTFNKDEMLFSYTFSKENFDIHPYNTCSVGIFFIPIVLFILLLPFIIKKDDDKSYLLFVITSPFIIFIMAYIDYSFAGVCPRYLNDFTPWASLLGGLIALKALEKNDSKHAIVPSLISVVLLINIVISTQYHFVTFDGLKVGDYNGLYALIKTIFNHYNI